MEKVMLFTQQNCMPCNMVKNMLEEMNIPYESVSLETEEGLQKFSEKGYSSTPIIETESGKTIIGFQPEEIEKLKQ